MTTYTVATANFVGDTGAVDGIIEHGTYDTLDEATAVANAVGTAEVPAEVIDNDEEKAVYTAA